jgi:hypothetical protein
VRSSTVEAIPTLLYGIEVSYYSLIVCGLNQPIVGFAISIETPPVDCQFGNAAKMFSNFFDSYCQS